MRFEDEALVATLTRIASLRPDVMALQSFDYDHAGVALSLVQERLEGLGHPMPHSFARAPNAGMSTGFDLDRDGRLDTATDRQGYGLFAGQGGVALLSRYPFEQIEALDFAAFLWRDLPHADLPPGYFTEAELAALRLHDIIAWDVPVRLPDGRIHILAAQLGPPVFDGPEDRNGRPNGDQLRFWLGHMKTLEAPFVLMGGLNNDPVDGEGLKPPLHALLASPLLQDPQPGGAGESGPDALDTVDWGPEIGRMRVDYILPSAGLGVAAAQIDRQPSEAGGAATAHDPVWVDIFWQ
jgi:endonuclease/exonuclease/phosphatase family metal-dependent hydrolase